MPEYTGMKRFYMRALAGLVVCLIASPGHAAALIWGDGRWGEKNWASEMTGPISPPEEPIPEAIKSNTLGGDKRYPEFSMGAYSDVGTPTYASEFSSGDFVTIVAEVRPDPVDVGSNGELFAAFLSIIGGKAIFSFLNEDGNFESWDTTLEGLGPARSATPLEEFHEITVFEGYLQAGTHKFTFAYQAEDGPLVYMKPIKLVVTP